ncbi:MAG: DUF115 domain-containing protein [Treponema sp.]|nr:DUF115 domain-containing protein [Treponema sp.]
MDITFQKAKNGETTALIGNLYLHSAYNPQKEAARFIENLNIPYNPKIIIITEPGLAYIKDYLRQKYPKSKIGLIRYVKGFEQYNQGFDLIINYYDLSSNFENYLLSVLGEELLLEAYFLQWEASSKILSEINLRVWQSIKSALEKAKTLLITRQYFEKKWLINTFNFIKYLRSPLLLKKNIDLPVLIIASGSSLKAFLPVIKENQKKFFIIVLSSAIRCCNDYGIKADLTLSTDGGYWAGQHLKTLNRSSYIIGASPEAFIPKRILINNSVMPLIYSEGLSKDLYDLCKLPYNKAVRNGTISGTALDLALDYFIQDIYICGLDLANCKGYQHTQLNELEINNSVNDNKINSKEKRLTRSQYSNSSLDIYREWFSGKNISSRKVYRLIEDEDKQNSLGKIKDINQRTFKGFINKLKDLNKNNLFCKFDFSYDKEVINKFLNKNFQEEKCKKQLYPLEYVLLNHEAGNKDIITRIENNHKKLYKKLWGIIND